MGKLELVEAEKENQLQVIVKNSGLETAKAKFILNQFQEYFDVAGEWEVRAKTIKVINPSQTSEMKMARVGRLFLKEKRVAIEKIRKHLKEQIVREGKTVDGIANVLKGLIVPVENYLYDQEHFVELKAQAEAEAERIREEQEEEQRLIAEEKKRVAEQKRIKKERDKLLREQKKAEKEKLERERQIAEEKRQREIEDERKRKEQEAKDRKAEAEKKRIQEEADRKLRLEKEKAEEKRRKAQKEADRKIEAQRVKTEKAEKELQEEIAREEREEQERIRDEKLAEEKRNQGTDREKMQLVLSEIETIKLPQVSSSNGQKVNDELWYHQNEMIKLLKHFINEDSKII